MDIERVTPERIRNSIDSLDEMFGDLHDFANSIGGKLWQDDRSLRTGLQRHISVPLEKSDLGEDLTVERALDTEDISISFEAEKELFDNECFYVTYDIEYSHRLQVSFEDLPSQYQEQFNEEIIDYDTDNDTQTILDSQTSIDEIHTHHYSILEEDDSVLYTEEIIYSWNNAIDVEGESFQSVNHREVVHDKATDGFARELGQYDDQIESADSSDPDTILYDHKFFELTENNSQVETLFHDNDEHARRIMALISLLGSDLLD